MSEVQEDEDEQQTEDNQNEYEKQHWIRNLVHSEGVFESPINITLTITKELEVPPLEWVNFDIPPKKMKVTNTGHTIIFSAKWGQERPYITSGPFFGKYVFSNWHLHWGSNDMEGSEHTIDGTRYPAEMHVVTFKSCYLTQEAALKEQDGCATLVYMFKLQDAPNPYFQIIIDALNDIQKSGTSKKLEPTVIKTLVRKFDSDYFLYWGAVSTSSCVHYIMWLITRVPIGVSSEQIDALRYIFDENGEQLTRNFRDVEELKNRTVLHIRPSSSKYATLLHLPNSISQIFRCEVMYSSQSSFGVSFKTDNMENEQSLKKRKKRKRKLKAADLIKYIFQ